MKNATYKRVANAAECTSLFRQGWAIKTKPQTDFEPRAAVFFSLDLTMVRGFCLCYTEKAAMVSPKC